MRARPSSMTVRLTFGSPARPSSISSIVVVDEGGVAEAARAGGGAASAAFAAGAARPMAQAATATAARVFMVPILGLRRAGPRCPFIHNGLHGGPDPAARRRLELPLSRLPCAPRPARPRRRPDRRDPRRRLDDEAAARAVPGGARRLR